MNYLADLIFDLRVRWSWFDDLVDFVWDGKCWHVDVCAPLDRQGEFLEYCNLLRREGEGQWTVRFVGKDWMPDDLMVLRAHRGSGLLRWGDWIDSTYLGRNDGDVSEA